jgi:peptidoglycan/xylan/chitin deacetylase (PgdA/CDA1 family)
MQKLETGLFVLSLDFELLWGVRDKRMIESYGENIRGVRQVIPGLLRLFSQYGIHATFATVGFYFAVTSRNYRTTFQR